MLTFQCQRLGPVCSTRSTPPMKCGNVSSSSSGRARRPVDAARRRDGCTPPWSGALVCGDGHVGSTHDDPPWTQPGATLRLWLSPQTSTTSWSGRACPDCFSPRRCCPTAGARHVRASCWSIPRQPSVGPPPTPTGRAARPRWTGGGSARGTSCASWTVTGTPAPSPSVTGAAPPSTGDAVAPSFSTRWPPTPGSHSCANRSTMSATVPTPLQHWSQAHG